ncbi:MAG: hypothetical protein HYV97_04640 [Bdellovibrio sp.]|nr:hypothetical protein [Bdellovibrio sp.]
MRLRHRLQICIFLMVIFVDTSVHGALTKLKPIITKQDITNLRFLSYDGRFSLYQRRSGSLLYSTNYKVTEIVKSTPGTHFTIIGSNTRKKLLIEERIDYFRSLSLRQANNIYVINYDGTGVRLFGKGQSPQLHLNDSWLSFYDPSIKELQFINITNDTLQFSIKINNPFNPYFIPQTIMLSESKVLLTDLNNAGHTALLEFDRKDKRFTTLQKISSHESKIEICNSDMSIFVSHIGINNSTNHSMVTQYPFHPFSIDNGKIVYESRNNEIGNMVCDFSPDKIYLVQVTPTSTASFSSEVVSINLTSKKVTTLSDLNNVTQILNLDGRLVTPFQGKFYMLEGTNNVFDDTLNVPPSSIASDPFIDKIDSAQTTPTPTATPAASTAKGATPKSNETGSGSGKK